MKTLNKQKKDGVKPCMHSMLCNVCNKPFQFDCHKLNINKEFAYTDGYDYDVDIYHYWAYVACPHCGNQVKVYDETHC